MASTFPARAAMSLGFDFKDTEELGLDTWTLEDLSTRSALLGVLFLGAKGSCSIQGAPDDDQYGQGATVWRCSVRTPLGRLATPFTMGAAHKGRVPNIFEIVQSLSQDALFAQECPTLEDAVASGSCGDPGDPLTAGRARHILKSIAKNQAGLARAFGPFAPNLESKLEARGLAQAAEALCLKLPLLALPALGKPFGLLELAAACGSCDVFSRAVAQAGRQPIETRRLAFSQSLAKAFEHSELADIARALIDRVELERSISCPAPLSKNKRAHGL